MPHFVVSNPLTLIIVFLCVLCVSNEHSEWAVNIFLICVIREICVQKELFSFMSYFIQGSQGDPLLAQAHSG